MLTLPDSERTRMGPSATFRSLTVFASLLRDSDLLRPMQTRLACVRTRRELLEAASKAAPIGECPLLLCRGVRRRIRPGTLAPEYILNGELIPPVGGIAHRSMATWCHFRRDTNDRLYEVRGQVHARRQPAASTVKSPPRHWCERNKTPCSAYGCGLARH